MEGCVSPWRAKNLHEVVEENLLDPSVGITLVIRRLISFLVIVLITAGARRSGQESHTSCLFVRQITKPASSREGETQQRAIDFFTFCATLLCHDLALGSRRSGQGPGQGNCVCGGDTAGVRCCQNKPQSKSFRKGRAKGGHLIVLVLDGLPALPLALARVLRTTRPVQIGGSLVLLHEILHNLLLHHRTAVFFLEVPGFPPICRPGPVYGVQLYPNARTRWSNSKQDDHGDALIGSEDHLWWAMSTHEIWGDGAATVEKPSRVFEVMASC
jgi:hypothetical protein